MRIISGTLRGAIIPTVKDSTYRPSTGKFKEAIFSILTSLQALQGKIALDLFAGTGSLGFEALSRGATHATFLDINTKHLNLAKSFAEKHGLMEKTRFINTDSTNLMPTDRKYDIVFLDPPYAKGIVEKALAKLIKSEWLNPGALLVIEVGAKEDVVLPEICKELDMRVYGGSKMIMAKYEG